MRKIFLTITVVVIATMLLVSCRFSATPITISASPAAQATATQPPVVTASQAPAATATSGPTPTMTPYPLATAEAGRVQIRWYIGLGTGTDPAQLPIEQSVVDDFNVSQSKIQLILEVVPSASARSTLAAEIASGKGPDLVGPVGWAASNDFYGEWADLAPLIQANHFDTRIFDKSLVNMYQTDQGQVGLPFAVSPFALEYNTDLFDEAGLAYPPATYGQQYTTADGTPVDWSWNTLAKVAQLLTLDKNGRNSTEPGFDKSHIVQYGFSWGSENQPEYWGAFYRAGSELGAGGARGNYLATIPQPWKDAWQWTYNGIWGPQPYIADHAVEQSAAFGGGNPFDSGKIAMTLAPSETLCCLRELKTWDFAAMPTYNGYVGGRVDADTFFILKTTQHLNEAFQAMVYLETTGVQKLITGTASTPPAYDSVTAISSARQAFLTAKEAQFPWVKNFNTLLAGLQYPDHPSAEVWVPNFNEAWDRNRTFGNLLTTTAGLDLAKEEATLASDLTVIYNK